MKVYTLNDDGLFAGVVLRSSKDQFILGAGSNCREVGAFRKNPPDMTPDPMGVRILEAHPMRVASGIALAKPHRESSAVLLFVKTREWMNTRGPHYGHAECLMGRNLTCLVEATGPRDFCGDQNSRSNWGWKDCLLELEEGAEVVVRFMNGTSCKIIYGSNGLERQVL